LSVVASDKRQDEAGNQNLSKAKTVQHANLLEFPHAGLGRIFRPVLAISWSNEATRIPFMAPSFSLWNQTFEGILLRCSVFSCIRSRGDGYICLHVMGRACQGAVSEPSGEFSTLIALDMPGQSSVSTSLLLEQNQDSYTQRRFYE
jgi:hypothetical protein